MSAPNANRSARELIEAQLEAMGELRNASARDPGFKAWRQTTLTAIQRVWPDDPSRAERFRRVPFSAPSSKMTATMMREFFEKGCAEAVHLLRAYVADADEVRPASADMRGGGRGFAPGDAEDDFPVLQLPGGPAKDPSDVIDEGVPMLDLGADGPPALPAASTSLPVSREMPRLGARAADEDAPGEPGHAGREAPSSEPSSESAGAMSDAQRELDAAIDAMGARPRPVPHRGKPGRDQRERDAHRDAARPARPARRERPRPPSRNFLKDMLGFADSADPAADEHEAVTEPPAPPMPASEPSAVTPPPPPPAPVMRAEPTSPPPPPTPVTRAVAPPPPPAAVPVAGERVAPAPARSVPAEVEPIGEEESLPPAETVYEIEIDVDDDPFALPDDTTPAEAVSPVRAPEAAEAASTPTDTFLRESPVLSATPRPLARAANTPVAPREGPSPTAATLAALASEIAYLGVPEGHRAAARAELLDLARRIDSGQGLTWDSLRGVIGYVMEYPPLARRVIPMLIPFLDLAA